MYRVYEIFEVLPNGSPQSPQRVSVVTDLEFAKVAPRKLHPTEMDTNVPFLRPPRDANQIVQTADGAGFLYDLLNTMKFLKKRGNLVWFIDRV